VPTRLPPAVARASRPRFCSNGNAGETPAPRRRKKPRARSTAAHAKRGRDPH
jgi:hypothetical protein